METSMSSHAETEEHAHPGPGLYIRIAVVLFVLTALEVGAYEVARRGTPAGLASMVEPLIVPILLVLSAIKFALVAMFYMHLKPDSKIFSGLFVFPLIIAAVIVVALVLLFSVVHLIP